ncbi:sulfur carrier protein ThiS [Microbulbifer hydrolyticus]|uniref:Sulfur carrier protein n=1 Tax=Microbulbifer hydrolyticus TaxID=48074 RepID=A0A6P1T9E2_9GAMM|nr:sulfur carrier protein ThiS [Microbulbifer hydrolyticus]MBB5213149.1 sulfur carrier protein [Microbulbifer hydrolyticus]QHQ38647.1 sulfur carrier protein ThiS [Microbulbifer hydrolyticus]
MQLLVNGENVTVNECDTVATLLQHLGYRGETFAVARNGDFVPRADYADTRLNHGDSLDIVAPVVGG